MGFLAIRFRHRLRHLPALALAAAALAVLPAAPALAAPAAVTTDPGPYPAAQDFYAPPTGLSALANGDVIRYQDSAVAYLGVPAKRIMYKSTDVNNNAVAVTGTLLLPPAPWQASAQRPLVSFAVGTIGQGDQCAPSKLFNQGLEYEAATIFPMLAAGVAVVVTDYQGLGTPDRVHTYVNRVDEAHAVLDAAIAAQQLSGLTRLGIPTDGPVGIYGYSQGGGASAAAAELQPSYAPRLNLRGAAVGAPPADLAKVAGQIDGTVLTGAVGYTINSIIQDYPQVVAPLSTLLNQRGKDVLAATKGQCVAETALRFGFQQTRDFTVSGDPVTTFLGTEPFKSIVAAQRIGNSTPTAPVYIWQGRNDDLIPFAQSLQLAKDWCDKHASVQFKEYDIPAVFPGFAVGHALPAVLGLPEAQGWLYQRFVGAPATSSCGSLPSA